MRWVGGWLGGTLNGWVGYRIGELSTGRVRLMLGE